MHPKFIKETAKCISIPITAIFNKSMDSMKIPEMWKLANITPLHKKKVQNTKSQTIVR